VFVPRRPRGYGDRVRDDPEFHEPRWPAVGIWTVTGFLVGVALSLVVGSFPVPALICAVLGLLFGLFMTRQKFVPDED
jgi:hypothetical protein